MYLGRSVDAFFNQILRCASCLVSCTRLFRSRTTHSLLWLSFFQARNAQPDLCSASLHSGHFSIFLFLTIDAESDDGNSERARFFDNNRRCRKTFFNSCLELLELEMASLLLESWRPILLELEQKQDSHFYEQPVQHIQQSQAGYGHIL